MYCILDGDADKLSDYKEITCWGGNFYEICRPAIGVIEFGMTDTQKNGKAYEYDMDAKIKWSGNCGDPEGNIRCFRELYDMGSRLTRFTAVSEIITSLNLPTPT